MLSLILHAVTCVWFLPAGVSAVTTETAVGVAGGTVTLPCRSEAAGQRGVEVCWGRGEPSLFTCRRTVTSAAGDQATYRKSNRYSVSSSSLIIYNLRPSDAGFYHCRVQLAGPFNDQTSTVHLIVITPRSVVSDSSDVAGTSELPDGAADGTLNAPRTTTNEPSGETGSDVTGPAVAPVQSSMQQVSSLQSFFIGNTLRVSFIIFIPALLLSAAYRVWSSNQRTKADGQLNQSEEEEEEERGRGGGGRGGRGRGGRGRGGGRGGGGRGRGGGASV